MIARDSILGPQSQVSDRAEAARRDEAAAAELIADMGSEWHVEQGTLGWDGQSAGYFAAAMPSKQRDRLVDHVGRVPMGALYDMPSYSEGASRQAAALSARLIVEAIQAGEQPPAAPHIGASRLI